MNILEALWHGDICPIAQAEYRDADYIALVRLYERSEQRLLAALNDGQKEDLQKMQDLVGQMRNMAECGAFMRGFRLAVQIMVAAAAK